MPNDVNTNKVSLTYIDRTGEKSTLQVTAKTFADNTAYTTAYNAFKSAVDGLSAGNLTDENASLSVRHSQAWSSVGDRELKYVVSYEDVVTNKRYVVSVPVADTSLPLGANDVLAINAGAGQTFKNAFEAFASSPDGNAVNVIQIRMGGRNI